MYMGLLVLYCNGLVSSVRVLLIGRRFRSSIKQSNAIYTIYDLEFSFTSKLSPEEKCEEDQEEEKKEEAEIWDT